MLKSILASLLLSALVPNYVFARDRVESISLNIRSGTYPKDILLGILGYDFYSGTRYTFDVKRFLVSNQKLDWQILGKGTYLFFEGKVKPQFEDCVATSDQINIYPGSRGYYEIALSEGNLQVLAVSGFPYELDFMNVSTFNNQAIFTLKYPNP